MLPNLPESNVKKAFVSAIMPSGMQKELNALGVECIYPQQAKNIKSELRFHPDIVICNVCEGVWYAEKSNEQTFDFGELRHLDKDLGEKYPEDCLLNNLVAGNNVICGVSADTAIFGDKNIIKVRQSYAKCSTIAVTPDAFITSDAGIFKALKMHGSDVLPVTNERIELNGYDCGFIGGCSGKISGTLLVFTGDVRKHAQYEDIKSFCRNYGVEIYSLGKNNLYDYGGILPIC